MSVTKYRKTYGPMIMVASALYANLALFTLSHIILLLYIYHKYMLLRECQAKT